VAVVIESKVILHPVDQLGRWFTLGDLRTLVKELDARGFEDSAHVSQRDGYLSITVEVPSA
jgi:hypothetical protein